MRWPNKRENQWRVLSHVSQKVISVINGASSMASSSSSYSRPHHYDDHLTKLLNNFHIAAIKHLKSKRVGTKSSVHHRRILAVSWRGGRDEVSNMILVGWWVVSEDLSTLGWELVVSKDKPPCHTRYSQSFFLMSRPLSRWSGWIRNIFSKCSFISLQSKLKGFYISFFKESTLYVISFSHSSCKKK